MPKAPANDPVPPHSGLPDGTCTCGADGYTATLACGCESWSHGEPKVGGYVTCGTSLAHQSSYKVLAVRPGKPDRAPRVRYQIFDPDGSTSTVHDTWAEFADELADAMAKLEPMNGELRVSRWPIDAKGNALLPDVPF